VLYVVMMRKLPIAVSKYPLTAINTARERSLDSDRAYVLAVRPEYWVGDEPDSWDDVTEVRCTPCSHGEPCDDTWKNSVSDSKGSS
jgi:hypothetical protein